MDSLRAVLQHANQYGLKFIFVHDPYYNPLLVFAEMASDRTYDSGAITVWSRMTLPAGPERSSPTQYRLPVKGCCGPATNWKQYSRDPLRQPPA
jgi:hypothetical protein